MGLGYSHLHVVTTLMPRRDLLPDIHILIFSTSRRDLPMSHHEKWFFSKTMSLTPLWPTLIHSRKSVIEPMTSHLNSYSLPLDRMTFVYLLWLFDTYIDSLWLFDMYEEPRSYTFGNVFIGMNFDTIWP